MANIRMASVKSLLVQPCAGEQPLATATGFLARDGEALYLVTNWHVVTGRHAISRQVLASTGAVPDSLVVWHNAAGFLGRWVAKSVQLYSDEDEPVWLEHPTHGHRVDVVAVPVVPEPDVAVHAYEPADPGPAVLSSPSNPVSIIGFPFGLSGSGRLAIWMQGTIASEMDVDFDDLPCFLVDSRTRAGHVKDHENSSVVITGIPQARGGR